jgi:hypothetical protein
MAGNPKGKRVTSSFLHMRGFLTPTIQQAIMPNMLAIVSKIVFEKEARHPGGTLLQVGDCYKTDRYRSTSALLQPLTEGGALFLVTVRPGDMLWLVGVLEYPKFKDGAWVGAGFNQVPVTDISSLCSQLRFASGRGIHFEPGKLGMVLQTPRVLTDDDILLLRGATKQIPLSTSLKAGIPAPKTPTTKKSRMTPLAGATLTPEKLKTLERLLRVSSRVKIDDMAAILGTSRADMLLKLLDYADEYRFKIEEEVIAFESGAVTGDFVKTLEKEFETWSRSSQKKDR